MNLLMFFILLPAVFAALEFLVPKNAKWLGGYVLVAGALSNLLLMIKLYGQQLSLSLPWGGFGLDFSLKLYDFNGFILLCAAIVGLLVALYSAASLKGKPYARRFNAFLLITITLVNGAVLANNLVVLLFFWEGILGTMFAMILASGVKAGKTAVKAIIIVGLTDLCLMLGIGLTAKLAGTLSMDGIHLPIDKATSFAFVLMLIGALGKAGAMPFHTWIPDAADDAPLPFMAFLPGALEKLLGIYLTVRLATGLFELKPGTGMSLAIMIVGAASILFAVMMALIQKDYKRLLSYHAVSQVGYMLLGIGTALPVGIVGGLFHMLNNATYKSCLFLTAGAVEKQAGTTDIRKLGGLFKFMPVTAVCFLIAAASIAGFPLTNGFFSKELIFDAAVESNIVFYIIAAVGAFFTAASFLKLGHAVYFGKREQPNEPVHEAPWAMLAPMIVLALTCIALGVMQGQVSKLFLSFLGGAAEGGEGFHTNYVLAGISMLVLLAAVASHYLGFKKTGKGVSASDHFHYAPVLHPIYDLAEKKAFDIYYLGGYAIRAYAGAALAVNNGISWFYDVCVVHVTQWISSRIRRAHTGSGTVYLVWTVAGIALVAVLIIAQLH